jgi:hypothetical protein
VCVGGEGGGLVLFKLTSRVISMVIIHKLGKLVLLAHGFVIISHV